MFYPLYRKRKADEAHWVRRTGCDRIGVQVRQNRCEAVTESVPGFDKIGVDLQQGCDKIGVGHMRL